MRTEIARQFVHLSGLLFVVFAQFTQRETAIAYFAMITAFFFLYSWYIRTQEDKAMRFVHMVENKFRSFAMWFERSDVKNPFTGAMFFYLSFTVAFILFPVSIASAACAMLAVGDSLSTIVGMRFGRHKIGKKSFEGFVACLTGSFIVGLFFVNPFLAVVGAATAALVEIIPRIDDNISIPMVSGLVMLLVSLV